MRTVLAVLNTSVVGSAALQAATAPTIAPITSLTGGDEDVVTVITYDDLLTASTAADIDGGTITLRIDSVTAGTLAIRSGASGAGTAVVDETTILSAGKQLLWLPALNSNGIIAAFTISAKDATNLVSASASSVQISVAAINDAPTLGSITTLAAGTEDTPMDIAGSAIQTAWDAADVDSPTPTSFRINAITTGGSLGVRLTANSGDTPTTVNVGDIIDASTQTLRWTPPLNANGDVIACDIQAYDGALASTTAGHVTVPLAAVRDDTRGMTFTWTPITLVRGVPTVLSFYDIRNATNFPDPGGNATAWLALASGTTPTSGWKFERLDSAHAVIAGHISDTTGTTPVYHGIILRRDEYVRITTTSALADANPVHFGGLQFEDPDAGTSTSATPSYYIINEPTGGSTSGSGSGDGGGCGAGATATMALGVILLGVRLRRSKSRREQA